MVQVVQLACPDFLRVVLCTSDNYAQVRLSIAYMNFSLHSYYMRFQVSTITKQ